MTDYGPDISPEVAMLATQMRHVCCVQEALLKVRQELETRGLVHDRSKLSPEELPGFVRINATARQYEYGSDEYRAAIRAEGPTVRRHQEWNSHHPEAHAAHALEGSVCMGVVDEGQPIHMGWLDIIEMVCDWWAASKTYGTSDWEDVLRIQLEERWKWLDGQKWLILQVAEWLGDPNA